MREFLLFMQTALDLTAFRDVHQRALISNNSSGSIANGRSRIETGDEGAVLAYQSNFAAG